MWPEGSPPGRGMLVWEATHCKAGAATMFPLKFTARNSNIYFPGVFRLSVAYIELFNSSAHSINVHYMPESEIQ